MTKAVLSDAKGHVACHICGQAFPASNMRDLISMRPDEPALIAHASPGWTEGRLRPENDDRANLKTALENHQLHARIGYRIAHQWGKLAESHQIRIDLSQETADGRH